MIRKIQTIISKLAKAESREDEAATNADEMSSVEQKVKAIMATVFKLSKYYLIPWVRSAG